MTRKQQNKQERYSVGVFKSLLPDFPPGEMLADETQERPDVLVKGEQDHISTRKSLDRRK